jgi:hypothetical protein
MGMDKQVESRGQEAKPKKKAYVKPSFQHEKVFETMALACGKIGGTLPQCKSNKKLS